MSLDASSIAWHSPGTVSHQPKSWLQIKKSTYHSITNPQRTSSRPRRLPNPDPNIYSPASKTFVARLFCLLLGITKRPFSTLDLEPQHHYHRCQSCCLHDRYMSTGSIGKLLPQRGRNAAAGVCFNSLLAPSLVFRNRWAGSERGCVHLCKTAIGV